jgi:carbon starvation protein CstA
MEGDAEIDQIKRELALLQARYALYGRAARMLRGFFIVLIVLMPLVVLVCAIRLFLFDALYGLFFVAMVIVFAVAITLFLKSSRFRWLDLASQFGCGILNPYFFYPDAGPRPRSDAQFLEMQIADRERRLSELGESVPHFKTD